MGLIIIIAFALLLLFGVPAAVSLGLVGITYVLINDIPLNLVVQRVTYSLDSFPLLAVPLFIFVGALINNTGTTTRIFRFARLVVGFVTGGMAQVNILTSLIFSGTSGAALADIGGVGSMEIRAMREAGYTRSFSAAVTSASATIGPIFPPSIPLIIYGAAAQTSGLRLLLAGIGPALVTMAALMILTAYLARRRNLPKDESSEWSKIVPAFLSALPALLTPVVLIAGMLSGVFSPTEAAAVTALYTLAITIVIYRDFSWHGLARALAETVKLTSTIMFVVAGAAIFSWTIAVEQVPAQLTQFFLNFSDIPLIALFLTALLLIIVGCFLESIAALLLLTPLIAPPLITLGVDPIHLGVIVVYTLMLGLLTPPLGLSLFLVSSIANVPVANVVRELIPYYIPLVATLILIILFPSLSLSIPNLVP